MKWRLAVLATAGLVLGGVVGCGGGASESYQAAMTAWESCTAQAPVGAKEPTACKHLAANECQAAKREHLKGTGTGLACEAVEGTVVVTANQLRAALLRCLAAWNDSAGAANRKAVAEGAYRTHEAAIADYAGTETTYVTQFGSGLTDKTADIAVPPSACIVSVFGPRRGFILTALESDFVQQSDGSWLEASGIHPDGPSELQPWATTHANVTALSLVTPDGVTGGTLAVSGEVAAFNLTAEALHGKDYAEALEDEKAHHAEAKPSAAECAECQPSPGEAQILPRPVGYTPANFAHEKAVLAEAKKGEQEVQQAAEVKTEAELERICKEGEPGSAQCAEGIEKCERSSACSKKYGLKYEPGRRAPVYPNFGGEKTSAGATPSSATGEMTTEHVTSSSGPFVFVSAAGASPNGVECTISPPFGSETGPSVFCASQAMGAVVPEEERSGCSGATPPPPGSAIYLGSQGPARAKCDEQPMDYPGTRILTLAPGNGLVDGSLSCTALSDKAIRCKNEQHSFTVSTTGWSHT
jgi:hypothetical protein